MSHIIKKVSRKSGLPPGSVVYVGDDKLMEVKVEMMEYNQSHLTHKLIKNIEECKNYRSKRAVTWINITGIHKVDVIRKIGKYFDLHPLTMEDIATQDQRPKLEEFDNYMFLVLKMLYFDEKKDEINSEQVSIILGKNFVLSFQESESPIFNPVRERIRTGKVRMRNLWSDYLAYSLMDIIIDNYFSILEKFGERIEDIEDELVKNPNQKTLNVIHKVKRELLFMRKAVWPLRDVINKMQREDSKFIKDSTIAYLRDLYDHTIQIIDTVETLRDITSGMIDVYLSSVSNKMNEIMKVLTVITTIFIPLSFVAGVYGMNFHFMPEISSPWGYPVYFWSIILVITTIMLIFFKKRKWI